MGLGRALALTKDQIERDQKPLLVSPCDGPRRFQQSLEGSREEDRPSLCSQGDVEGTVR